MMKTSLLLGLGLCLGLAQGAQAQLCRPINSSGYQGQLNQLFACSSDSAFWIFPNLWSPVKVTVTCPSTSFSLYSAKSSEDLAQRLQYQDTAWCGVNALLDGKRCELSLSPFTTSLVGIKSSKPCEIEAVSSPDYAIPICLVAGLVLFFAAQVLTHSLLFRLSAGTALFTLGSLLILAVLLIRLLPRKREAIAAAATFGTSGLAAVRWVYGRWLPSLEQLLHNRFLMAFVSLSAVVGAMATYLLDNPENPRLNILIMVGLKIVGLLLVYHGTWLVPALSSVFIVSLVMSQVLPQMLEQAQDTTRRVQQATQATMAVLTTPFRASPMLLSRFRTAAGAGLPPSAAATPVSFAATPGVPASVAGTPGSTSPLGRGLAKVHSWLRPRPMAMAMPPGALSSLGRPGSPLHLRTPPPNPWDVMLPDSGRIKTFEEKMEETVRRRAAAASGTAGTRLTPAGSRRAPSAAANPGEDETAGNASGSVVGGSRRTTRAASGLGLPTAAAASGELAPGVGLDNVNQLVREGRILNEVTGRPITINGSTFKKLVDMGAQVDWPAGVIRSPRTGPR